MCNDLFDDDVDEDVLDDDPDIGDSPCPYCGDYDCNGRCDDDPDWDDDDPENPEP